MRDYLMRSNFRIYFKSSKETTKRGISSPLQTSSMLLSVTKSKLWEEWLIIHLTSMTTVKSYLWWYAKVLLIMTLSTLWVPTTSGRPLQLTKNPSLWNNSQKTLKQNSLDKKLLRAERTITHRQNKGMTYKKLRKVKNM